MYKVSQTEYRNSNITIIEDNEDFAKLDIITSKGNIHREKALIIADDDHGDDLTVVIENLTDIDKEKLFDALDASLHDNTYTNAYMIDRIIYLQGQIDDLTESLEPHTEESVYDGEYDFYEE